MRDRSTITDFVLAFREKWLAAMTGGLSVPFAALAAWADNQYAKLTFAALAFADVWSAAYQVWKVERERVVSLERQLATAQPRNKFSTRSTILSSRRNRFGEGEWPATSSWLSMQPSLMLLTHPCGRWSLPCFPLQRLGR